jgi:hypothetical protein
MDSEVAEKPGHWLHWVVAALSLLMAVCLTNLPERAWVFSDTAHYMSVARLLQSGEGISTDLIYYSEQAHLGTLPAPQTVFPPGYPIVAAVIASVSPLDHHDAGRLVCLIAYACIGPLIYLLGTAVGIKPSLSAISSLFWMTFVAGWMPLWCYSTDVLFVALTLASMLCFVEADGHWKGLLVAGLLAACAVTVRYAGVFLGIAYGVIFLLRHRTNLLRSVRDGCFAIGPPLLITLVLFARNRILVGNWKGGNKYAGHELTYVLKKFYHCICEFTGFSLKELQEGKLFCVAQVAFAACLTIAVVVALARHRDAVWRRLTGRMGIILVYAPLSIGLLIVLHARSSSGMTPRLFLPVVPCLLHTIAYLFFKLAENYRQLRIAVCVVATAGLASVLIGQTRCYADFRIRTKRGVVTRQLLREQIDANQTLQQFLQTNCNRNNTLLSSMPQMTHLFVERPSVGLPTGVFNVTGEPWSFDRVKALARRFRIRHVLLLTHEDVSVHRSEFFFRLSEGDMPAWLRSTHVSDNFQLFEVTLSDEDDPKSDRGDQKF